MDDFGTSELLVLSVAGPATVLKALRATLVTKNRQFKLYTTDSLSFSSSVDPFSKNHHLNRSPWGYRGYTHALGLGTHHMLLVSKRPGLLMCLDDDAIWQEISGVRFTTPLQKAWTPYIVGKLKQDRRLEECTAWGCKPALLTAEDSHLDAVVQAGVRSGHLAITHSLVEEAA